MTEMDVIRRMIKMVIRARKQGCLTLVIGSPELDKHWQIHVVETECQLMSSTEEIDDKAIWQANL